MSQEKGFTLIELVLYLGITIAVLFAGTIFIWDIIDNKNKATAYQEVQQNAKFALEKIAQQIKSASEITSIIPEYPVPVWHNFNIVNFGIDKVYNYRKLINMFSDTKVWQSNSVT